MSIKKTFTLIVIIYISMLGTMTYAHHVLGRPSYSLNEDSNTPPSMAIETQIGDYFITYMIFPAFPKPEEYGRINVYATRIDNGQTLDQAVTFSVRDDTLFGEFFDIGSSREPEIIGVQNIDDGVYRQGFLFKAEGDYIVRAYFEDAGEPYTIDFPLQIGTGNTLEPIGAALGLLFILLVSINIVQRKRIARSKIQRGHQSA